MSAPLSDRRVLIAQISDLPPSFMIEPPAFHLHVWLPPDGPNDEFATLVTHWVPIGDFAGPYHFFNDHGELL